MPVTLRYSLATGEITSTLSQPITNAAQIAALKAAGHGLYDNAPDGTDSPNAMIDLDTGALISLTPAQQVPNLLVQYVAAQITAGNVDVNAFHPTTVARLNAALTSANMSAVTATAAPAPLSASSAAASSAVSGASPTP
jgi:hypothetical protein